MAATRRGRSDSLSNGEQECLNAGLEEYIKNRLAAGEPLWPFGKYGESGSNLEKKAPVLEDLIACAKLLMVFLSVMQCGKCRDAYVLLALDGCMRDLRKVNTTDLPDDLFRIWVARSVHLMVSHVRMLKQYGPRFAYRISKLTSDSRATVDLLVDCIRGPSQEDSAPPALQRKSTFLDRVPTIFMQSDAGQVLSPHEPTKDIMSKVPRIFFPAVLPPPVTPPVVRKRTVDLFSEALATPPPPAKRGGIKARCESSVPRPVPAVGSCRAYVEHAWKGSVRSYVRVQRGDSKKVFWAVVSAKQHADHAAIVEKVADAINSGEIESKQAAQRLRDQLAGY